MHRKAKVLITSLIGNVVEYYGFTIFAVFASHIGQVFFPKYDPYLQVLFAQLLFGAGFITRPLGSIVLGHFGDKAGRRKVLICTILGMAIVTSAIGFVPGFASIGIAAPIIVLILRLCQGFFVGGEGPGIALYMLEYQQTKNKGMIGGIVKTSIIFGALSATLVGLAISKFYKVDDFSWRIAFFIGGVAGLIGLYLRFSIPETNDFIEVKKKKTIVKLPILEVLKYYWKKMIVIALLGAVASGISYMLMGYLVTHLKQNLHVPEDKAMLYSVYSLITYIFMLVILGRISDIVGFRRFIHFFCLAIIVLAVPLYKALSSDNTFILFIGLTLLPILSAGVGAPSYPYIHKMFKTELRYSGVAVSFTIGMTLAGFTPAICTFLTEITGLNYAAALYIMGLSSLYLIAEKVLQVKEYDDLMDDQPATPDLILEEEALG